MQIVSTMFEDSGAILYDCRKLRKLVKHVTPRYFFSRVIISSILFAVSLFFLFHALQHGLATPILLSSFTGVVLASCFMGAVAVIASIQLQKYEKMGDFRWVPREFILAAEQAAILVFDYPIETQRLLDILSKAPVETFEAWMLALKESRAELGSLLLTWIDQNH